MDRGELGKRVERARLARGWSKEQAAREAGISAITWKRIEDGLGVQDAKRAQALAAIGLDDHGDGVGGRSEDPGYVAAPGESVESDVTNAELLQELRAVREDVNALSRRVARLESGPEPVGGLDGPV